MATNTSTGSNLGSGSGMGSGSGSGSGSGTNRMAVPEAKSAMDKFKTEVASEIGVNLKQGYNGDLTSKQAGSIGGEMVKKMIARQEEQMKSTQ